jgi:hypothetical protein
VVLGLDWSQANINVFTHKPPPNTSDYAGLPVMHSIDPTNCIPISACYPDADQPKMDDRAALSRLYPVTSANQANFPGKLPLADHTVRIHGSVFFVDANGQPAPPMQGVNVVARWIDPATGLASRTYVASCVSGFLFSGNVGNPATGFNDSAGHPFTQFGSDDSSVEGFFDLAGLEIPNAATSAQYELSVEALDPLWSQTMGPYAPSQVEPSGEPQSIVVTVTKGSDLLQDLLMQGSALQAEDWFAPTSYTAPAALPASGAWAGSLGLYGDADYFWFSGHANRTLSVEVTALDESATPSTNKAQPVIGMWALDDPGTFPAPANTPSAFNSATFATTRLDATFNSTTNFRLGIFDYRGDGRPDYQYLARVLYADTITPPRASAGGGTPLDIQGIGFRPNTSANIAAKSVPVLSASANQLIAIAPAIADGLQSVIFSDPATGGSSSMINVLTVGAGPNDTIKLISGSNPTTPVGGEAPNPIRLQVLAADGATPVNGASVFLTASPPVSFSACGGAASCTLLSDENGEVSSRVTVLSAAVITITALLAPASYTNPKSVQTPLLGTSSSLDISVLSPSVWVAQGASLDLPIKGRVLSNGKPLVASSVAYNVVKGSATLSSATAATDNDGFAAIILHVSSLGGNVQVSVCAEPGNKPCQLFSVFPVPASVFQLRPVSGSEQAIAAGQSFRPLTVRVTDSSTPANPVIGANVVFQTIVIRSVSDPPPVSVGGIIINREPPPVILSSSKSSVNSGVDGLASFQPSTGGFSAPLTIQGTASAGGEALSFELRSFGTVAGPARLKLINLSDFVKKKSHSVSFLRPLNTHSEKPSPATSEVRSHLMK